MIINLKDEILQLAKDDLITILKDNGFKITNLGNDKWIIINEENHIDKLLIKGREIFRNFGYEKSPTSSSPHYAIIDDINMEINFIFIRTQKGSGSTIQKLTYGNFMINDYIKQYPKLKEYDLNISNVFSKFHGDESLVELMNYLKGNLINVWINKIKI